jgi:hypothetical protein
MTEQKMEQTKKCSKCSEPIQKSAQKCKHCGADLRNWFAKHKIITVILALFALGIIGSAINGGGSNTANKTVGDNSIKAESEQQVYKIGDSVMIGKFTYKAGKSEEAASVGQSYASRQADGIYKIIPIILRNDDTQPRIADSNMFHLIDNQGRTFNHSVEASTAFSIAHGTEDFFLKTANPGIEITGVLIFDIPKDAKGLKLEVSGSFGSSQKAYISLD